MTTSSTLYRATVSRVDSEGVFVQVPNLGLGTEYGPCEVYIPPFGLGDVPGDPPITEVDVDQGGTGATWRTHDHPDFGQGGSTGYTLSPHRHLLVPTLKVGSAVLVSSIGTIKDDLVILGVLF